MTFPPDYVFAMSEGRILQHFPNLRLNENFRFTSKRTDEYNCVAWAKEIDDEWIQFAYDDVGNYDNHVSKYIAHFVELGFVETDNREVEINISKIAIYADHKGDFTHISRQLPDGKWTSKMGDWEDIEHDTLEALGGRSYGNPYIIMAK